MPENDNARKMPEIREILEQAALARSHLDRLRGMLRAADEGGTLSGMVRTVYEQLNMLAGNAKPEAAKSDPPMAPNPKQDPVRKQPPASPARPKPATAPAPKPAPIQKPEPRPAPAPVSTPVPRPAVGVPAYDAEAIRTLLTKPIGWSKEKRLAVRRNPTIHPDSIDNAGVIRKIPWTWTAVSFVLHNSQAMTVPEMGSKLALPASEVRELLMRMDLPEKRPGPDDEKPEAPPRKAPPVPKPENNVNTHADLEKYLPEFAKKPPIRTRVTVLRLYTGMSHSDLAKAAGIGNANFVRQLESGDRIITDAHIQRMSAVFANRLGDRLTGEKPLTSTSMSDVIPLASVSEPAERVRLIRCRMALSTRELATRLGITDVQYIHLEQTCTSRVLLDEIVKVMHIDVRVLDDVCGEPSGRECDVLQTGLNVDAMLKAKNVRLQEAADRVGVTAPALSAVASGTTAPSFRLSAALSEFLGCDTNAFYAVVGP